MSIKSIQTKLKLILLSVLCASAVNFSAFAANKVVTSSLTESGSSYNNSDPTKAALNVSGEGTTYNGTGVTLSATANSTSFDYNTAIGKGAYVADRAALSLTGGSITTSGSYGYGIFLGGSSSGTVNNVNIETQGYMNYGVCADNSSTLTLTGGGITIGGNYGAFGIYLESNSTGTVSDVNIEAQGQSGHGVFVNYYSTLTLTDSTITTGSAYGIYLARHSSGTLNNVSIETQGYYGVRMIEASTLTLTGGTITSDGIGISLESNSSGTVSNVTIETKGEGDGGVFVSGTSTLTLTGGTITTGSSNAHGISLNSTSTGTLSNVTIETKGTNSRGIYVETSTLTLNGGTIGGTGIGIYLEGSTGTVCNVNIETTGSGNFGVLLRSSTLTLTGGTITTDGSYTYGILLDFDNKSSGTVSNVSIKTTGNSGWGVYADGCTLALTDSEINTIGSGAYGIQLWVGGNFTGSNVAIETKGYAACGIFAASSTLSLTGGTITTGSTYAYGIYMSSDASGTVSNVAIETKGSHGVFAEYSSTLTLADSAITTGSNNAHGIYFTGTSNATVRNVDIKTKGSSAHGLYATTSSTLTLTDSDISATGANSNALYLLDRSTGTASLNHNTLTGHILASNTSTLHLTGSNGTLITGNLTGTLGSTLNLTLTGSDTRLIGTAAHDTTSAINLNIENGTQLDQLNGNITTLTLQNGAVLSSDDGTLLLNGAIITVNTTLLALADGAILTYNNETPLSLTGNLAIGNGILVDFSNLTETGLCTVLDWSNATITGGDITADQFNIAGTEVEGTFTVSGKTLTFTAIPEPSTWFLLGLGILILTARHQATHPRTPCGSKLNRS
jgi:hypothetical protein